MEEELREECYELLRLFSDNEKLKAFKPPIDPVRKHCPIYLEVLEDPIDIKTLTVCFVFIDYGVGESGQDAF